MSSENQNTPKNPQINISFSSINNIQNPPEQQPAPERQLKKEIEHKENLHKGNILDGQFIMGEKIGNGTFGVVRSAIHIITGEKVAIKIMDKHMILKETDKTHLEREIKILKILQHSNIVQLFNVIQTNNMIYLIQEYIKGKELFEYIVHKKRLSELESCKLYQQIISGIEYLGKVYVSHRDLKPENLLIDKKLHLKIVDFGLSNMYKNNELLSTACGSPCYAAPEMLSGQKYNGLMVDIWSSGIILYAMLCGGVPFEDQNNEKLYQKIMSGKYKIPNFLSDGAKDIISKILVIDPKKRYTINQIKKHPWFNQIDQRKNMSRGLLLNKFVVPIDDLIVEKMVNDFGYNSKKIKTFLLCNKHNDITTCYYLLLKQKIRNGENSICDPNSKDFYNYTHNKKNLLASYNWNFKKIVKERVFDKKNQTQRNSIKNNNNNNDDLKNSETEKNKNICEIKNEVLCEKNLISLSDHDSNKIKTHSQSIEKNKNILELTNDTNNNIENKDKKDNKDNIEHIEYMENKENTQPKTVNKKNNRVLKYPEKLVNENNSRRKSQSSAGVVLVNGYVPNILRKNKYSKTLKIQNTRKSTATKNKNNINSRFDFYPINYVNGSYMNNINKRKSVNQIFITVNNENNFRNQKINPKKFINKKQNSGKECKIITVNKRIPINLNNKEMSSCFNKRKIYSTSVNSRIEKNKVKKNLKNYEGKLLLHKKEDFTFGINDLNKDYFESGKDILFINEPIKNEMSLKKCINTASIEGSKKTKRIYSNDKIEDMFLKKKARNKNFNDKNNRIKNYRHIKRQHSDWFIFDDFFDKENIDIKRNFSMYDVLLNRKDFIKINLDKI